MDSDHVAIESIEEIRIPHTFLEPHCLHRPSDFQESLLLLFSYSLAIVVNIAALEF